MKASALFPVAIPVSDCVSITPRAQKVRLAAADSASLADCIKLGALDAGASAMGQRNADDLDLQAKNNLRDAAAAR